MSAAADNEDLVLIAGPFIKRELTAGYIRVKTEQLIDDTESWMKGKTENSPVLSFADIKNKLTEKNYTLLSRLEAFSEELAKEKVKLRKQAENENDPETRAALNNLPDFDFNSFVKSDFSIPLGKHFKGLKLLYVLTQTGLFIIGFILLLALLLIYIVNTSQKQRFRWFGIVFILAFIWNAGPWLFINLASKLITGYVLLNNDIPAFVHPLFDTLVTPILNTYFQTGGIMLLLLLLGGICCLILSAILNRSMTQVKTDSPARKATIVKRKSHSRRSLKKNR